MRAQHLHCVHCYHMKYPKRHAGSAEEPGSPRSVAAKSLKRAEREQTPRCERPRVQGRTEGPQPFLHARSRKGKASATSEPRSARA